MKDVDVRVLFDCEHQPLAGGDVNSGKTFDSQFGHYWILTRT